MKTYVVAITSLLLASSFAGAGPLVYEGESGPGKGKHLVFVASDHEYRGEETLPALARILAKHHGFKCTVLFGVNAETGEIEPGFSNNVPGLEVLKDADLMVIFTRFQDFPGEQMDHIVAYLDRGGPVIGLRTSTHGFKIPADSPYAKYDFKSEVEGYEGGFGEQVLGETWVGHYGKNHVQSTRMDLVAEQSDHPILKGVKDAWVQAGGYWAEPGDECTVLAMAQPLQNMEPDGPADPEKPAVPTFWTREYVSASGKSGRVVTSTQGASEDILNEGYRRMLINGVFWAVGLEDKIEADACVVFVGPYEPNTFRGGGYGKGVKPEDLAGWDTPVVPVKAEAPAPKAKGGNKGKPQKKKAKS